MQTFLPYPDFAETARVLDNKRLAKQRVETLQLVLALTRQNLDGTPKTGRTWADHPAGRMWDGYLHSLYDYQFAVCREWTEVRGYRDTCLDKTFAAIQRVAPALALVCAVGPSLDSPWWLGDPAFHRAHQSNLIRKLPQHYGPLFPGVPPDLTYVWPSASDEPE